MKIRTRTRLILVITIIIFLVALSFITQSVILTSFRAIEQQQATANMQRVLSSLNDEVEQVAAQCRGWAEWDDTYRFINDTNPGYIASNLASPTAFRNRGINYMLFFNSAGDLVYAKGFDSDGSQLPVTSELIGIIRSSIIPDGVPGGVSGRRGFSILNGEPVILVGYSITSSDQASPSRGTLVMVRKFDSQQLNYVAQQTQLAITFEPVSKQSPSGLYNATEWSRILKGAIITKPLNDSIMTGAAVVTGIENKPTMLLVNVETSRPVYQQVQTSIEIVAAAIIIISILLFVVVQLLLQRFVLAPLSTLDYDIKVIGKSGDLSHPVPEEGDEEIASLSHSLNHMLKVIRAQRDDLNNAKRDLADRNEELEQLVEEIGQQRDELHGAREELDRRNRQLEELNRKANLYLDIYLDAISYEILNAIMGLRGYAELLKERSGEKEKLMADRIIGLAEKSDDVIRNIETISRIYKTPPEVHPVDLGNVIRHEISMLPDMNITVKNCDKTVLANDMVGVIFNNIFSNSRKYGGAGVKVEVETREIGDGMVEITVSDTGPGIPDEMKSQVFDRFMEDSKTRSSYGLGLHIVKMLVESYGGKVRADNRVEGDYSQGAVIRFTLRVL